MPTLEKSPIGFDATSPSHRFIAELLREADIQLDGSRPWDIQLYAPGVIDSALSRGNLDLAKATCEGSGMPYG